MIIWIAKIDILFLCKKNFFKLLFLKSYDRIKSKSFLIEDYTHEFFRYDNC